MVTVVILKLLLLLAVDKSFTDGRYGRKLSDASSGVSLSFVPSLEEIITLPEQVEVFIEIYLTHRHWRAQ